MSKVMQCADIPGAPIAQAGAFKSWGTGQNRSFFLNCGWPGNGSQPAVIKLSV